MKYFKYPFEKVVVSFDASDIAYVKPYGGKEYKTTPRNDIVAEAALGGLEITKEEYEKA